MKTSSFNSSVALLFALALFSDCGRSDEEVRSLARDEIARSMSRTYFTDAQVIGPYSPAVRVGSILFISGQIGLNPETMELSGDDIESQTRAALQNLLSIARKAGFDSTDIIQCTVYLKDINDFQKMNLIYGGFFAEGSYPTRATVEVSNLPRKARVEIAAVAVKNHIH